MRREGGVEGGREGSVTKERDGGEKEPGKEARNEKEKQKGGGWGRRERKKGKRGKGTDVNAAGLG